MWFSSLHWGLGYFTSILINGGNYSNYPFRLKLSEVRSMSTHAIERERSKTFHKATKNYFGIPIRCLGYY